MGRRNNRVGLVWGEGVIWCSKRDTPFEGTSLGTSTLLSFLKPPLSLFCSSLYVSSLLQFEHRMANDGEILALVCSSYQLFWEILICEESHSFDILGMNLLNLPDRKPYRSMFEFGLDLILAAQRFASSH